MSTKLSTRQSNNAAALPMIGSAAADTLDTILAKIDPELSKIFEDRNAILAGGGTVTVNGTGTSVTFGAALKLHINSQVAGGAPTIIDLASTTRAFTSDGNMLYAVIDRIAGTATVTADSSTLPTVTSSNKEVFLIAKRIGTSIFWRNGFVIPAGRAVTLGSPDIYGSVGATDNQLLRSDGTDGKTIQGTGITVDDSQNVSGAASLAIGEALAASSILDVASTTKGALLPRMTTTQRDAIASPAEGLEIYNTTTHQKNIYNGTTWGAVGGGSGSGINYITYPDAESGIGTWVQYSNVQTVTFTGSSTTATVGSTTGMYVGQPMIFGSTSALPAAITAGTTYYVQSIGSSTTFSVSATLGGAAITFATAGTGTHFARPLTPTGQTALTVSENLKLTTTASSPLLGLNSFLITQANTPANQTVTVTIATPGVFSATAHGLAINQLVWLTTTGALPTGLTALTPYYVISAGFTANAFQVSTTLGGTAVNTTGSQSGTHTLRVGATAAEWGGSAGEGVYIPFTIDAAYKSQQLGVSLNFNADSNFSAGDSVTTPNSGGAGDSDLEFFIWDVTNSTLISVTPQTIVANGSNNFIFNGIFQAASNSASYRLVIHQAKSSHATTGFNFKFDNVVVGPSLASQGSIITDSVLASGWTFSASFGTVTNNLRQRRVGDYLHLTGSFIPGSTTAATAKLILPTGLTIDSAKLPSSAQGCVVGLALTPGGASTAVFSQNNSAVVFYDGSDTTALYLSVTESSNTFQKANGNTGWGSPVTVSIEVWIPISGWASNNANTSLGVVAAKYYLSSATQVVNSTTPVNFDAKIYDTSGAVTTGAAWKFTAQVSGLYQVKVYALASAVAGSGWITLFKNGAVEEFGQQFSSTILTPTISASIQLVAGDYLDVRSASNNITFAGGAFTSGASKIEIELIPSPGASVAIPRSEVTVSVGNGHGGTNTKIRRFTTINKNIGGNITYADSSTLGGSFTINQAGVYAISYSDRNTTTQSQFGVSVNTSVPTTSIPTATYAQGRRMFTQTGSGGTYSSVAVTLNLAAGDVVRAHTDGTQNDTTDDVMFTITQVSN